MKKQLEALRLIHEEAHKPTVNLSLISYLSGSAHQLGEIQQAEEDAQTILNDAKTARQNLLQRQQERDIVGLLDNLKSEMDATIELRNTNDLINQLVSITTEQAFAEVLANKKRTKRSLSAKTRAFLKVFADYNKGDVTRQDFVLNLIEVGVFTDEQSVIIMEFFEAILNGSSEVGGNTNNEPTQAQAFAAASN